MLVYFLWCHHGRMLQGPTQRPFSRWVQKHNVKMVTAQIKVTAFFVVPPWQDAAGGDPKAVFQVGTKLVA